MEITLNNQQLYPVGATVKAYPRSNWSKSETPPIGAPVGAATAETVVAANGNVTFTGLPEKTKFYAVVQVDGVYRYVRFETAIPKATAEGDAAAIAAETVAREAADAVTEGEGAPARFTKGATYIQKEGVKKIAQWEGRGAGEDPIQRLDLTGTPADGSVSTAKFAAANIDGAAGVPSARTLDTDSTLAANSDVRVASQKAAKAYVDNLLTASEAVVFKGVKDCSANPNYPEAKAGYLYRVSVAGKIGGGAGVNVEVGDTLLCITNAAAGTQAEVGAKWELIQANIDGAVVGPAAATDGNLASYNGATGKIVKDSGLSLDTDNTLAANSDTRLPSQKAVKGFIASESGLLIPKSIGTAKGDAISFSAAGVPVRVPAAAVDNMLLGADSTQASGQRFFRRAEVTGLRSTKPPSGNWLTTAHNARGSTQLSAGQKETLYLLPVDVVAETTFKAIGLSVQTKAVGTGFVARLGYYEDDGTGYKPTGNPLLDAGTVSLEVEGERNIAIEKVLQTGRYWIGFVMEATVFTTYPFVTTCQPLTCSLGGGSLTNSSNFGSLKQAGVAGVLPVIGALEAASSNVLLGLQVK